MKIEHRYVLDDEEVNLVRLAIIEISGALIWLMVNEPEMFNHLMVKHRLDTHLDTLGSMFDIGIENTEE